MNETEITESRKRARLCMCVKRICVCVCVCVCVCDIHFAMVRIMDNLLAYYVCY